MAKTTSRAKQRKPHQCGQCDRRFASKRALYDHIAAKHDDGLDVGAGEPDWNGKCEVCGASPIVPETGMCGPCTFGEADTVGGNW